MIDSDIITLIKQRLATFAPTHLEVIDEGYQHAGHAPKQAGKGYFAITIVSTQFVGHTLVQRHRMIYAALSDLMDTRIHALRIQTYTTDEFSH